MSATINSQSDSVITLCQDMKYNVSVTASDATTTRQLIYRLLSISDGGFITNDESLNPLGETIDIDFIGDAARTLESTFPVGLATNGHIDTAAAKSFSPNFGCLETDIEDCTTEEVGTIGGSEIRVINSRCDLDLTNDVVLSKRPTTMFMDRDSHQSMAVFIRAGAILPLRINGTLLGNIPASATNSVVIIDFTRFVSSTTESVSYTIGADEYKVIIKNCTGGIPVYGLESCGSWTCIDFNHKRSFSVETIGTESTQGKNTFFSDLTGTGIYTLETCLDLEFADREFLESWLNSKQQKIKLNGTWQDCRILNGTFEVSKDEETVIFSVQVKLNKIKTSL